MSDQEGNPEELMTGPKGTPKKVRRKEGNVSDEPSASTSSEVLPPKVETVADLSAVAVEVLPEDMAEHTLPVPENFPSPPENVPQPLPAISADVVEDDCEQADPISLTDLDEYKWVRNLRYKPFGEDSRRITDVDKKTKSHHTHLLSLLISDTWCFEVSARKVEKLPAEVKNKLGVCVTFPKNYFYLCPILNCRKCGFYKCLACPHQYRCDCDTKVFYSGGYWCPHIHLAYARNMEVYGSEVCLYILHNPTNLTEKRHIRAMIQGPNKMSKVKPDTYIENFEYLVRSMRHRVTLEYKKTAPRECTSDQAKKCMHCDACWCCYSCSCEDYWHDRQVCEHIHIAAMLEQQDVGLDQIFSFSQFQETNQILREPTDSTQEILACRMLEEHEMSFYVPFRFIEEVKKDQEWRLMATAERKVVTVTVNSSQESQCICKQVSTTKANMCMSCNICAYHYTCDCKIKDVDVCRHMHTMAQFRKLDLNEGSLEDDKLQLYNTLLSAYEKRIEETDELPTREPKGLVRDCLGFSRPSTR